MTKKPIPVHAYFILDCSGSMQHLRREVEAGYQRFIEDQKKLPGKFRFTLVEFEGDRHGDVVIDAQDIEDVPSEMRFTTGGMTPLWDAVGSTIARATEREADRLRNGKRKEQIVVVILTDGHENTSSEYNAEQVRGMIADREKVSGWAFTYLGVGLDAMGHGQQAASGGLHKGATKHATATAAGMAATYDSASVAMTNSRSNAIAGRNTSSAELYDTPTFVPDPAAPPAKKKVPTDRDPHLVKKS